MGLFSFKKSWQSRKKSARFRTRYFQQRITQARNYKRPTRIVPKAKTKISLRTQAFKLTFYKIIFLGIVLAIGYFLIISNLFLVTEVNVLGNEQVQSDKIESWVEDAGESRVWKLVPRNHILLLSEKRLYSILSEKTPYIFDVTRVSRKGINKIEITVEERVPLAIWKTGEKFFYIDKLGIAYEQVVSGYATSTENYIQIEDITETPIIVGEDLKILQVIEFFNKAFLNWDKNITPGIDYIKIPGRFGQEIQFFSKEGWAVIFDISTEAYKQVQSLRLILDQEIPPDRRKEVAYIDLRLPNKAYYCFQGEPCSVIQTQDELVE